MTRELSTTRTWMEVLGSVTYMANLEKHDEDGVKFAEYSSGFFKDTGVCTVTVFHTRDSYLPLNFTTISYFTSTHSLSRFNFWDARLSVFGAFRRHRGNRKRGVALLFTSGDCDCLGEGFGGSRVYNHGLLKRPLDDLEGAGCLRDGKLGLKVMILRKENA